MKDTFGFTYAKLDNLHAGDFVRLDNGFTCCPPGFVQLKSDAKGSLYFECSEGAHFLDGQLADNNIHLIGVYSE